jgi:prevent-host-death family protein
MERIPQIEPISKMKHRYNEVLQQLKDGPVVLTQHGRATAVVVDPAQWNAAIEEREELLDAIAALKAEAALARGEANCEDIEPAAFIAEITGDAIQT